MSLGFQKFPILKLVITFIIGISLAHYIDIEINLKYFFLLVTTAIILLLFFKINAFYKSVLILLAFLLCGVLHYNLNTLDYSYAHFSKNNTSSILIYHVDDFQKTKNGYNISAIVDYIGSDIDSLKECSGKIQVYSKLNKPPEVGQQFLTTDSYYLQQENKNPRVFDYKSYLSNQNIYHKMYSDSLRNTDLCINKNNSKVIFTNFRETCSEIFRTHIHNHNQNY